MTERYLTIEVTRTFRVPDSMSDKDVMRVASETPALELVEAGLECLIDEETDRSLWRGDAYKHL